MSYLFAHPLHVAALGAAHLALVATALAAALAIALPLGLVLARREHASNLVLGVLGAIYTIPSLALLAVLVELIGLGSAPIFVALVAYAQFVLVRNVIAGVRGVDPAQRDAALGMGMSAVQRTWRVIVPQALPVVVGGVRVAAVAMVALATLGGYVGAGGLGSLIFIGFTIHHTDEIVAGSVAACALAIAIDGSLRLLERLVRVN
ncbi:MAG TPA: ABC transporter permease subunit [Candidatus Baltobacteraceae bacterium]|nr:ABC transporter permease subunit [Candidatus Baltobacteraceae bacterium]